MDVIDWLLEDDAPGAAYLARRDLLGEEPDSRRMKGLRKRCNEYAPVARILDRVDEALNSSNYHPSNYQKYKGAFWTLIFLGELYADGRDERVRRVAEHVLATQLPCGGFSATAERRFEIVCLTANLVRSLVTVGYGDDPRIRAGYERLIERIGEHKGVPCVVLDHTLQTSCKMTLPQTLLCLAAAPMGVAPRKLARVRKLLIEQLLAVRVYRYVRPDVKEFQSALAERPKGVKAGEFRDRWLTDHRVDAAELAPKPGWLRFGFPRHYNSDILEALLALARAGVKPTAVLDEALDHVESRRLSDGRWKLDDSLNGKMHADVERKGRPSKWITLRALTVLRHFGRL